MRERDGEETGMGAVSGGLSMESSLVRKALMAVMMTVRRPRSTVSWIVRGHLARDRVFVGQTYWFAGMLPRVPVKSVCEGIEHVEVRLPRAFDRRAGTSISVDEACHLGAIARWVGARRILEIGTYDGNTAVVLAANMAEGGVVVTVDLPPDFEATRQSELAYPGGELNLTPRHELGRQYEGHNNDGARIQQVYGDSAMIDWSTLGGPFDLVFIDGCHTEAYVRSDSANAMRHLAAGGIIVWHDYGMIRAVSHVVDQMTREATAMRVYALEGTRLAIALT
jgi:predicted O-methyltransferase YrrM